MELTGVVGKLGAGTRFELAARAVARQRVRHARRHDGVHETRLAGQRSKAAAPVTTSNANYYQQLAYSACINIT